jgi:hypothetical protein
MSDSYVFISYSRQDRQFVQRLTAGLRAAGIRTWTDLDNIAAGEDWNKEIDRGLTEAMALIYVSSKHSAKSEWMNQEFRTFLAGKKRVIPIVADEEGASNMPLGLRTIQWVDFRHGFEPALQILLDGIQHLQGPAPISPAKPKSKGYVFISYVEEDSNFVSDLKQFLKKREYGYWDYRESQRNYQSDYTLELENIIKNAAGTLSVVSPDWKRSPTAFQELHFSREVSTPVFLLEVKDPGPTLAISGMTYIDFIQHREDGFAQLDGEMRRKGL